MDIRNGVLEPDAYYHIYNRGINSEKIFNTIENYLFFLKKLSVHESPICEVEDINLKIKFKQYEIN
jgi:putative transposase